jgi:hypothetical protein
LENNVKKVNNTISFSLLSLIIGLGAGILVTASAQDGGKVFELRIYTVTGGHLDNLNARFRDHTTGIFRKHGMGVVGYWSPTSEEEADDTLVYLLEHESQETANASWDAFGEDPEWLAVAGDVPRSALTIERRYMTATDYSPMK